MPVNHLFNFKSRFFLTSWIRIPNTDPDPGDHWIRIQNRSGSKTLLNWVSADPVFPVYRVGSDWSPCWSESPSPPTTRPGRCFTLPPTGGSTRSSPPPARYRVRITSLFSSRRKIMQVPVLNLTQFFLFNYCICILCITFPTNLKLFYSVLPN